ncbi:hypothetical protein GCM10009557_54210 [Virgisporangium ochraceum]
MHDQETYARAPSYSGAHEANDTSSKAAVAAETAKETVKDEAGNVGDNAKEQAGAVVGEARGQVRRLASQAKDQATDRVRGQHNQLVDRLRGISDEFAEMGGDGSSPGRALVGDLGQRGQRVADYLSDRGPEGLVSELTDFARRRPFAFIAGAVAAGFLVGRLGKNVWKAQQDDQESKRVSDSYRSRQPAYATEEPVVAAPVVTRPVVTETVATGTGATEPYPASTQTYQSTSAQGYPATAEPYPVTEPYPAAPAVPPQGYPDYTDPRTGGQQ